MEAHRPRTDARGNGHADVVTQDLVSQRPRLVALAYRMLGSRGEAEDVVQEAYLRWYAAPRAGGVRGLLRAALYSPPALRLLGHMILAVGVKPEAR